MRTMEQVVRELVKDEKSVQFLLELLQLAAQHVKERKRLTEEQRQKLSKQLDDEFANVVAALLQQAADMELDIPSFPELFSDAEEDETG